jgi:hypothetical protein
MKKPVIRSPLDKMPLHQVQQLIAWLTTGGAGGYGITYAAARRLCLEHFGIKTSHGALANFYARHRRNHEPRIAASFDPAKGALTLVIHLTPHPQPTIPNNT